MEFSTMKTLIEQIIETKQDMKEVYKSNGNGPDSTSCPFCNSSEHVRFKSGGWIDYRATINTLLNDDNCIYSLITKLENTMVNENIEKQLDSIIIDKDKYNEEILYDGRDGELL